MQPTGFSRTPSTPRPLWVFLSRYPSKYRVFRRVQEKRKCKHAQNKRAFFVLCLFVALLYKHSLVRRRNWRSSGDDRSECQAPDDSTKLRVRSVFLHQRNEWHNEATPLNVREPSVALPAGLCRMANGGNT